MRSSTPPSFEGRCPRCFLRTDVCLCAHVQTVVPRTQLLVLRHCSEAWKTTNTGRLASLVVPSMQLVSYGRLEDTVDPAWFSEEGTALLYPDGPAWPEGAAPPRTVVVLDATWPQARRMIQRVPALNKLPRVALPPPVDRARRLRIPPHPDGMSTIEAIAGVLGSLEGEELARPLLEVHERAIQAVVTTRGDFITPRFEARARARRQTS